MKTSRATTQLKMRNQAKKKKNITQVEMNNKNL